MKYLSYLIIVSQLFLNLKSNSETKKLIGENSLVWEVLDKEVENTKKQIEWRVITGENDSFKIAEDNVDGKLDSKFGKGYKEYKNKNIFEISPIIPLNNFINANNIEGSVEWKSSFGGGKAGGTGQQNNSFRVVYGLTDFTQITGYFTEADDDTYQYINGKRSQYSWQSYALSLKQKIWDSQKFNSSLSLFSSTEYWRISSGSDSSKSIYNELNDSFGKDKYGKFLYSFALPFTKEINKNIHYTLVPGFISFPDKIGDKTKRKNFYGKNFYIGQGISYELFDDFTLIGSLTHPLGPGNNHFDKNLTFNKKQIYSFGLNWNINKKIGIETKLTNGFGSTPSTGILTIPSDNLPLYTANIKYNPKGEDTYLETLNERDKLISYGGITVNNALIPKNGTSQYSLNYDSKGNYFGNYSYSLSNIFQLELINMGSFKNGNQNNYTSNKFNNTYLDSNNFHIRLGGKFLIFSPQKNDVLWTSLRTSVGRNETSNQGYVFSELINTYRINNWIAANLSSKYFLSGMKKFGGIGASMYFNLSDNLQIIPEINYLLDKDVKSNNTISIRYSLSENNSIDLYLSNSIGTQDLGQLLTSRDNRVGFKLNLIY